ncbi:MAG: 16S rRNA (cytidine(1402)-2'-O)-methyltransferase [Alphaproteobacteria bacterium]|nr:16S rRNA (cytidine(1402)-2'-O)-methyltransferase [Alphaproteobacteria bacterium]
MSSRENRGRSSAARPERGDTSPPAAPSKLAGLRGLFVVATPIGNLGDLSTRAREVLAQVDLIACEDTRVSAVLLDRNGIGTSTTPYHDHNADRVRPQILARLQRGETVALISDAGTPLISDPGFKLVRACIDAGVPVTPVPGPSAAMTALMVAGLPTDRFYFAGFLAAKAGARDRALEELSRLPATLVFFEAPGRAAESLAAMAVALGNRPAALCRELTKLHEEVRRGDLATLANDATNNPPRGEVVIVVGGAPDAAPETDADVDRALGAALKSYSIRDAVDLVTAGSGRPRRDVYARALALSRAKAR